MQGKICTTFIMMEHDPKEEKCKIGGSPPKKIVKLKYYSNFTKYFNNDRV